MDTQNQNQENKVCTQHKQSAILLDIQYQPLCILCVQEKTEIAQIDQIQQKQQEIKIKGAKLFQEENQQLKQLQDYILQYKQSIMKEIDKIIQIIIDQMEKNNQFKEKFQYQLASCNQMDSLQQLNNDLHEQQGNHKQLQQQIKKLLSDIQQKYIILDEFDQIKESSKQTEEQQVDSTSQQDQQNKIYQFELVKGLEKKDAGYIYDFGFNKDGNIIAIARGLEIAIHQFINGKIGNNVYSLKDHKDWIQCLYFMKKSNCVVSGSLDRTIIIRKFDNYFSNCVSQTLENHNYYVNCILFNNNEDLMISGSDDKTIKFWKENNGKWVCYQTIKLEHSVWAISLNETENKLITCGPAKCVYVIEICNNNQWDIVQKIYVNECGRRLSFTIQDQFVFQPETKDHLEIYEYDTSYNEYKKHSTVKTQSCDKLYQQFPAQYIKSLKVLLVKHGEFVNIIQIKDDRSYDLIQTIKFEHFHLFGRVSNDGQYLITWDYGSKTIQVRRLKLINQ